MYAGVKELQEKDYDWFVAENKKAKEYAGSEWRPWKLDGILLWLAVRHKYTYTENEQDIYGGDWDQLDIKQSHSKYGANYIYLDRVRKLWRLKETAGEYYEHKPYRRPVTKVESVAEFQAALNK